MKKNILFLFFFSLLIGAAAQNQIRLKAGFLGTYTAIAEYRQFGQGYLLDSVDLDKQVFGALAALEVDLDLGKNFFMVTGFGYNRKGLNEITVIDVFGNSSSRAARQNYLGLNIQLKYHFKLKDSKVGLFIATGPKIDFAIGEPNYAEFSLASGSEAFQAFGGFNEVEFLWYTNLGVTYKWGPGDLYFDINILNGLSDAILNKYIIGKTTSVGIALGYSIYLD